MKNFRISMNEISFLLTQEIEANTADEAQDKFIELWENGMIDANDVELKLVECEEISEV